MKLARIFISNFRSIGVRGVELEFRHNIVVLVGKNNAGKSNILDAVQHLLGAKNPRYVSIPAASFNDPSKPIVIAAEFSELDYGAGKRIGLSDLQCQNLMKEPTSRTARTPGHLTLRLSVPPPRPGGEIIEDEEGGDEAAEKGAGEKKELLVVLGGHFEVRKTEPIRKAIIKLIAVPPVRDQSDILSPSMWTTYGRFLHDVLSETEEAAKLAGLIRQATELVQSILSGETKTLARAARTTAYVDSVEFRMTKEGEPAELLRNVALMVSYGGRTDDLARMGTGTQSAVILALLEICLRRAAKKGLRFFLVEEPELYLHPHAQRYVASLLREVAGEPENFVILTTHSPTIVANTDMLDVVRVDRTKAEGTVCTRIPEDYAGLEEAERILNSETCEMFFAGRVVLVEGESEAAFLGLVAPHVKDKGGESCDPNPRDVSFVRAGGKDSFLPYTELLKALGAQWRVLADLDALNGSSLATFKKSAGLTGSETPKAKIESLRKVGVCVLSNGEIEDYYGNEALAAIAGCTEEEAAGSLRAHRCAYDEPRALELFAELVRRNQTEIGTTATERLAKLTERWYNQTLVAMREEGRITTAEAKTGDAMSRWLKKPKPIVAAKVGRWMAEKPERVPEPVRALIRWLVSGGEAEPSEGSGARV